MSGFCIRWAKPKAVCAWLVGAGLASAPGFAAVTSFVPTRDDMVLEAVPLRARLGTGVVRTPVQAAELARQLIETARTQSDPRYLGRAQSVLAPWSDRPDAPVALAVLQATVLQGQHQFQAARQVLEHVVRREPRMAQAWLTLATLERLQGHYPAALRACEQVAASGAKVYALACYYEVKSLQGDGAIARQGLQQLITQAHVPGQQAWLASLLAESEERAGRREAAIRAYAQSLVLQSDPYTALAYADLLNRNGQPRQALRVLASQPDSDGVLLRRAYAQRLSADPAWRASADALRARFAAAQARGEVDPGHAREQGLAALWLQDDAEKALRLAQLNLQQQREPIDWWLAVHSARQAGDAAAEREFRQQIAQIGLHDRRLSDRSESAQPVPSHQGPAR